MKKLFTKLFLITAFCFTGSVSAAYVLELGDSVQLGGQVNGPLLNGTGDILNRYEFDLGSDVTGLKVELGGLAVDMDGVKFTEAGLTPAEWAAASGTPLEVGETTTFTVTSAGDYWLGVKGAITNPWSGIYSVTVTAVPLPAAFWMFGTALMGLFAFARRRNQHAKYA